MRPTHLTVRGLKSWADRELDLDPLMAIQGPNGSGKSALIEAIRIALLGYNPDTGKLLKNTRTLVPDGTDRAEIGLAFDTGFAIRRRVGAETEIQVLPPRGEKSVGERQRRIDAETGGLVVALDLQEFLGLSADKRRAWLFERLPRDDAALDLPTFLQWTDGEEGPLSDVVTRLWKENVVTADNPAVGLSSAIEVAGAESLEADGDKRAQEKVAQGAVARLLEVDEPKLADPELVQELEQRRRSIDQRIGSARAGAESRRKIAKRIESAKEQLGRAMREAEHTTKVRADLDNQLDGLQVVEFEDGHAAQVVEFEDQLGSLAGDQGTLAIECERLSVLRDEAASVVLELKIRRDAIKNIGLCPYAGAGCETDTGELAVSAIEGIDADIARKLILREEAEVVHEQAKADVRGASEEIDRVGDWLQSLKRRERDVAAFAGKRAELQTSIESKRITLIEIDERCGLRRADQWAAEKELAELGSDDAIKALYEERDTVEEASKALMKLRDAGVRYTTTVAARDREEKQLENLTQRAVDLKELDGNLRRLRAHVIQRMIEPLHQHADRLLRSIDPHKGFRFVFERENRGVMDFGFEQDGVFRSFKAASKGERVMLGVAFLGALLAVLKPPMRLLVIDDLEQLDPERRRRLMEAIVTLMEEGNAWDSVIVAGACDLKAPGWTLEVLGEIEGAVAA